MTNNIKLTTKFVHPPIGTRLYDWCCFPTGDEESCYYGWGMTEQAAIDNWKSCWKDLLEEGFDIHDQ